MSLNLLNIKVLSVKLRFSCSKRSRSRNRWTVYNSVGERNPHLWFHLTTIMSVFNADLIGFLLNKSKQNKTERMVINKETISDLVHISNIRSDNSARVSNWFNHLNPHTVFSLRKTLFLIFFRWRHGAALGSEVNGRHSQHSLFLCRVFVQVKLVHFCWK